jgi:hypothetical protein
MKSFAYVIYRHVSIFKVSECKIHFANEMKFSINLKDLFGNVIRLNLRFHILHYTMFHTKYWQDCGSPRTYQYSGRWLSMVVAVVGSIQRWNYALNVVVSRAFVYGPWLACRRSKYG